MTYYSAKRTGTRYDHPFDAVLGEFCDHPRGQIKIKQHGSLSPLALSVAPCRSDFKCLQHRCTYFTWSGSGTSSDAHHQKGDVGALLQLLRHDTKLHFVDVPNNWKTLHVKRSSRTNKTVSFFHPRENSLKYHELYSYAISNSAQHNGLGSRRDSQHANALEKGTVVLCTVPTARVEVGMFVRLA